MKILITGVAGFIGFSFANYLCKKNKKINVIGIDNFNSYYSTSYKRLRIKELMINKNFKFHKIDIIKYNDLEELFKKNNFDFVFNFAAQAGVRHSIYRPRDYIGSNINGFFNILELIKKYKVKKLFYASSSSVYGEKKFFPTKEEDSLSPINIYSLSKNVNEKMAEIYSRIYNINSIGLRFFTVYGEWGRPDMFLFKIFNSIIKKNFFELNNAGKHQRDFTYIEDVSFILEKLLKKKLRKKHTVINICSGKTININNLVKLIKKKNNLKIKKTSRNSADLLKTHGSNKKLLKIIGKYKFKKIEDNLDKIFLWFKNKKIYSLM